MNLLNTLTKLIPLAVGVMGAVEKMYIAIKGEGSKKRDAYIQGMMAALGVTEGVINRDLLTEEETKKFEELLGKLADHVVEVSNFIRDIKAREAKKEDKDGN